MDFKRNLKLTLNNVYITASKILYPVLKLFLSIFLHFDFEKKKFFTFKWCSPTSICMWVRFNVNMDITTFEPHKLKPIIINKNI